MTNEDTKPEAPKRRPAKKKRPAKRPTTPRKPRKKKPVVDPNRKFYVAAFVLLAALAIGQPIYHAFFKPSVDPSKPVPVVPDDPIPDDPAPVVNPFRDLADKIPGWVSEYIQTPKVADHVAAMREALGEVLAGYESYPTQAAVFADIESKVRAKVGSDGWLELGWFMLKVRESFAEGRKAGLLDSTPASAKAFFEAWKKGVDNA